MKTVVRISILFVPVVVLTALLSGFDTDHDRSESESEAAAEISDVGAVTASAEIGNPLKRGMVWRTAYPHCLLT